MKRTSKVGQEFKAAQEELKQQNKVRPVRPDLVGIFMSKLEDNYTPQEVKKVYWELAQQYHPDNGGHKLDWLCLQDAFEVFSQD